MKKWLVNPTYQVQFSVIRAIKSQLLRISHHITFLLSVQILHAGSLQVWMDGWMSFALLSESFFSLTRMLYRFLQMAKLYLDDRGKLYSQMFCLFPLHTFRKSGPYSAETSQHLPCPFQVIGNRINRLLSRQFLFSALRIGTKEVCVISDSITYITCRRLHMWKSLGETNDTQRYV